MRIFSVSLAMVFLSANSANAQVKFDQCVELAKAITVAEDIKISDDNFDALKHYAYCEASTSSKSGSLDVAFKAFNLGGKASSANSNKICKLDRSQVSVSASEYSRVARLFDNTLPTIDKCITAASSGWDINYQKIHKDAIGIGISHNGETGGIVHGVDILKGNGEAFCEGRPGKFPVKVLKSQPITMTCQRIPKVSQVSGVEVTSGESVTVNLRLGSGPVPMVLPGYRGAVYDGMKAEIDALRSTLKASVSKIEKSVSNVDNRLDNYRGSLGRWSGGETKRKSQRKKVVCPSGQYIAGIKGIDIDGGKFCKSCISDIEFYCRPLPKP